MSALAYAYETYSSSSLTRRSGSPSWTDLVHSFIGCCSTEALGDESKFAGRMATWRLGPLGFVHTQVRGMPVRAAPNRRHTVSDWQDTWLGMCLVGGFRIASQRCTREVGPAQIAVLDRAAPRTLTFAADCDLLWVQIPRVLLPAHSIDQDALVIDGTRGAGCVVQNALRGLIHLPNEDAVEDSALIVDGIVKLIAAALTPPQRPSGRTLTATTRTLARIKQYVEEHLGDERLSLICVADALNLSPRYINKLFAHEGTSLMRWTWNRRLEHARLALATGGYRSISEVAYASGFKNLSHFSRSFRARYGCAPSRFLQGPTA